MAANITNLLTDSGKLIVSVPFAWQVHGYPDDYWRFTPSGIRTLFPGLLFDNSSTSLSTSSIGEIVSADEQLGQVDLAVSLADVPGVAGKLLWSSFKLLRKLGALPPGLNHPYVYPPVLVHMVGTTTNTAVST